MVELPSTFFLLTYHRSDSMRMNPSPNLMLMLKSTKGLRIPTGCKLSSPG